MIAEETRQEIRDTYRIGNVTIKSLAEKYKCSQNTVSRIINENGGSLKNIPNKISIPVTTKVQSKPKQTSTVQKKVITSQQPQQNNIVINVQKRKNLSVGLINDRHIMPVEEFIFDRVDNEDLFDYQMYDKVVSDFINKNVIGKDEFSTKNLIVYVTGLTPATASVIKVCSEKKINLTLMHYNHQTEKYNSQVIYSDFGPTINSISNVFNGATDKITFHENSMNVINDKENYTLYVVKIFKKDSITKSDNGISYDIFQSESYAMKFFLANIQSTYKNLDNDLVTILMEKGSVNYKVNRYIKQKLCLRFHNFEVK